MNVLQVFGLAEFAREVNKLLKTKNLITQPTVNDYNTSVNQINRDNRKVVRDMDVSLTKLEEAQALLEDRYGRLLELEKELRRLTFICQELLDGIRIN